MNKKFVFTFVIFLLVACAPKTPPDLQSTISVAIEQTRKAEEALVTQMPPTNTPAPTNTPQPPNTPRPTSTPRPTNTKTPIPQPIYLTGSGDTIIDFENTFQIAIVKINGNSASSHFAVINYGKNGDKYDLLVNTTDPYEGILPLDFHEDEHTTRFEVKAKGSWEITILPLSSARVLSVPGSVSGSGDDVILLIGSAPDIAIISGNSESRHFAVISYGSSKDLLVNTTDPYNGTVVLDKDTLILTINSESNWNIEVKKK